MIKRIVNFALRQPLFVILGTLLFVGAGLAAFKSLPIEAFPDVTDTQVNVITLFPGRAAEEVERQVTIPLEVVLALIGGIFALLATGIPLSVSAAIGFIALFGQAVLNGVVMVSYFNQLRNAGASPYEAVMKGSLVRLRTVLMTGLLAMLGLAPMAISTGIGSETQKPLAVVVIGGLISATILTLIVLPTLYLVVQERFPKRARKAAGAH